MKLPKKKIWYACGIPLFLIGGLFLWLALWANHWENQWETFKRDAEAQGESFAVGFAKPRVPDEENYLEHPWVKSVCAENRHLPADADQIKIEELLEQIRGNEDEKPEPLEDQGQWLSRAQMMLGIYRNDLVGMKESAARPACWSDLSHGEGGSDPWFSLQHWWGLLELQYWYHAQLNDQDQMIEDAKIFLQMAEHAHSEPQLVT